ncbi:MAG TPA: DEAD/DEAH box helicase family protein, partial [Candidatus Moranbacteria bacterium]|nr:DEAD/DEAH box helicase family protein [Candidatus Moranbacteria bacterium]
MKFKFDANQGYQLDAIQAAADLFKGQQESRSSYEISFRSETVLFGQSTVQTDLGLGNALSIGDLALQENLSLVQKRNGILDRTELQKQGKNFAIEMETGSGKTYVYLRTLFELNKVYGYKKFIIVVPSIAIREGVLKSIAITREHFSELYNNVPVDSFVYDSKRAANLRSFA